jgi:UDP-N-acetylmuramate: L-alanyl-gamma-D-glutamyl-meso-diaminopimelate ligase
MHVHILGICGTLMGSIALLAREKGDTVTGTDENVYPPMSTQLADAGIEVSAGYTADCIPGGTDLVIVGNANLPRGNPALEAVLDRGLPYTSGAEWLGRYLLQDRWVLAVAGTHGKTTTSSMVAWILDYAGLSPGFLIGGVPQNFGQSSRLGSEPFFVIEADEYDTSYFDRRSKFLHYRPRTLVLNNLEYDHADIFPDLEAIKAQFHLLLRTVPGQGLVIHPDDDDHLRDVLGRGCWSETLAIGTPAFEATPLAADCSSFQVSINETVIGEVNWDLTGAHNMQNAVAAVAAARHAGVAAAVACEALCEFQSVKRRMEVLYRDSSVTVYDDFAHHPTAIATTLAGLRARVGNEFIRAIIEPASHTMRKGTHQHQLLQSADDADEVIWFQPANADWDMATLESGHSSIESELGALLQHAVAVPDDRPAHLVIMSNGSFQGVHQQIVDHFQDR